MQDILKKWYNLDTHLFCSTFIQFYGETLRDDPNFHARKYNYALVMSDFNRKIKKASRLNLKFLSGCKLLVSFSSNAADFEN